jgi:hypothetical protein
MATGRTPCLDDVRHAGTRHFVGIEPHQDRPRALGLAQDAQSRLRHDAKLPFGAADQPQQIIARRIQMRAADLHHLPVHRDHGHAQQVVRRHPVFQAMRPAGIHRDIARDGAGQLARRIGRVEEILFLHRAGHAQVRAPRLHPDEAVVVVDFQHPVQARHAKDHAIGGGQRAPGQRCARPARDHGNALRMADLHDRRDLFGAERAARRPAAGICRRSARRTHRRAYRGPPPLTRAVARVIGKEI